MDGQTKTTEIQQIKQFKIQTNISASRFCRNRDIRKVIFLPISIYNKYNVYKFKIMKTKNLKKMTTAILFMVFTGIAAFAQQSDKPKKATWSVEIDPATFVFNGYGVHFRIKPAKSEHWLFGGGTYAMDMPDVLVDFNKNNKGNNWKVRLNQGYGLFGEHHFSQVNKNWFAGTQVGIQEYKIKQEQSGESEKYSNILIMAYGGYTWQPFKFNLYIKPWAGIGYVSKIAGNNVVGDETYDIAPITIFATLHLGYTF